MMHFRHHGNGKMVPDVKIILRGDSVIKKEMIAMLLAGGQGSRLGVLTSKVAKPAVAFGGKYRIIDFPLSNCINSGVDTVGVLTQYQPLRLNTHIGIGIPWDLDRNVGGVTVLPPYEKSSKTEWYTGTANAIYQNLNYMETYNPEYVLILSGDHIYKMDYEVMLDFHKATNADVTIAVMPVPIEEASRFGIVVSDENSQIQELNEQAAEKESEIADLQTQLNTAKASSVKNSSSSTSSEKSSSSSSTAVSSSATVQESAPSTSYTVYITKTGEKYHRDGCRYLKKSQIAIDKDDAVAQGYTPCSVCNP